ncbi:MAG: class I SAM-dependent methyltransferase [Bacteroidota bacterium]
MEHIAAVNMIREGVAGPQWADLGAGTGTFTRALAALMPKSNDTLIYAIDKDGTALQKIETRFNDVRIKKLSLDFITQDLPLTELDGILMANALHYAEDKIPLLTKLKNMLKPHGRLILIEYDTAKPNAWVPYPINFESAKEVLLNAGFQSVIKLAELPSVYHQRMYAALAV